MSSFRPDAYWEARLRRQYDARGVGDIGISRAYNAHLYAVRRRVFRRILNRLSLDAPKTTVLDVGSGTGVYVHEWRRWGAAEVTGLDITAIAVARLGEMFPGVRFVQADIGERSTPEDMNSGYDVVSAFDVLFHVVDDQRYEQALQNIFSLLRPGGWFLYSDNLVPREARLGHYVSRSESNILGSLRAKGFEITARFPMFVLMNDPVRTTSRVLRKWHSVVHRLAGHSELLGGVLGAVLYPFELAATRVIGRGPGTEILVCRRPVEQ
ncbi:MAG: class I SAM-dependent methyltransferase [Gemmatimonadaceae bacterium]